MSAKDDYEHAKRFVAEESSMPLVDRVRSLITSVRLDEREFASNLAKRWAEALKEVDDGWRSSWLLNLADQIKNHNPDLPKVTVTDVMDSTEPLEAIEEKNL